MQKKSLITGLLLLMSAVVLNAQTSIITGSIKDEAGVPLIGANIVVKGTTTGAVTDFDGNYSISASKGAVLIVSYTGYQTKEITVDSNTTIDVVLAEDTQALDEVVLIGYGSRKKSDVVSAISTVDNEFLRQQPSADATRALQGSASGINVVANARPGSQAQVRIRGIGSINGNDPLYVVDGVIVIDANIPPPAQIESIQVLKDASSTAIYGARGARGVILIKTKSGKRGQSARFDVNVRTGIGFNNAKYDLVTDPNLIGQMLWLEQTNDGITPSHPHFQFDPNDITATRVNDFLFPNGASFGDPSTDPSLYDLETYPITETNKAGTDWLEELYQPALLQDYTLGIAGGSDKTTYAFNANFFNEEGVFRYNSFTRYAIRSNIDTKLNDWLTIGQRLGATLGETRGNTVGFNAIAETSPLIPVFDIAGNFAGGHVGGNLNDGPNPLGNNFRERKDLDKELNITGNFYTEIMPIKDLRIKTLFGYNLFWRSIRNPRFGDPENTNGTTVATLQEIRRNDLRWNWSNTISYSKTLNDVHKIDALFGVEANRYERDDIVAGRADFFSTDDAFFELRGGAGNITNGSFRENESLFSIFGRAFYSYDDKYILEATLRRDASSNFLNNRSDIFPAVSGGWMISKESFMEGTSDWLRQLKLRAAWGESGNDDVGGSINNFSTFNSGLGSSFYGIAGNDNVISQGFQTATFGNPDAKWETTESLNYGFDATLGFGLNISLDIWKRTTRDMLFPVSVPDVEGIARAPFINIGTMENKGVDLELNYNRQFNNDFRMNVGVNFSTYRNKVINFSDNPDQVLIGRQLRSQNYTRSMRGRAFPEFFGYVIDGIFQTQAQADAHPENTLEDGYNQPGNLIFRDVNGDNVINAEDRTWIGNPHPDFTAGLNLGFEYKNFDLTMLWYASVGNDVINYYNRFTRYGLFQGPKAADRLFRSWGSPYLANNADAVLPKASSTTSLEQETHSDLVEDGSFLRLKSMQLGYNLPQKTLDKLGISSMRLYLMGTNFITFSNYSGLDPEVSPEFEIDRGFDDGTWPAPKQFIFGLNLSL